MHTPGEWRDSRSSKDAIVSDNPVTDIAENHDQTYVKKLVDLYDGYPICESVKPQNKPIIKAAPEMYEALKAIVDDIPLTSKEGRPDYGVTVTSDKITLARQALTKADGRMQP